MHYNIFFDFQPNSPSRGCYRTMTSGLALHVSQRRKGAVVGHADGAEDAFVLVDVFLQRKQQALGMFGHEDDARLHAGLGHARQHADEVEHKLRAGVGDDGQVGIRALGHVFLKFYLYLSVVVFWFVHDSICFRVSSLYNVSGR